MGPWVVTADEVPNPHALKVYCWHKGELIAEDSTAYMNYKANEIIKFISRYQTLEPGDVISLGTAFRPQHGSKRSLHLANLTRLGGPVSVEIEGIGRLENPVTCL
ncbi:MAG: 2,4-diketo-3-deoxy-L-fuconate hydrolase [Parasphingorhabdus sp.]|jgi:2,4-diketo-3-deoxy-L-fuconate hydrolase